MSHASDADRQVLREIASLLDYPGLGTPQRARACARAVAAARPRAAERFARFACECEAIAPGRLEELYTTAFDLAPTCVPYVGYHLFGEGRERGMFLARLREMQRAEGIVPGDELPDHVCEVLRYLASARDGEEREALLTEGLAPAADKMEAALAEARHPWAEIAGALCELLRCPIDTATGAAVCEEVLP